MSLHISRTWPRACSRSTPLITRGRQKRRSIWSSSRFCKRPLSSKVSAHIPVRYASKTQSMQAVAARSSPLEDHGCTPEVEVSAEREIICTVPTRLTYAKALPALESSPCDWDKSQCATLDHRKPHRSRLSTISDSFAPFEQTMKSRSCIGAYATGSKCDEFRYHNVKSRRAQRRQRSTVRQMPVKPAGELKSSRRSRGYYSTSQPSRSRRHPSCLSQSAPAPGWRKCSSSGRCRSSCAEWWCA